MKLIAVGSPQRTLSLTSRLSGVSICFLLLWACGVFSSLRALGQAAEPSIAGDHPDPSVVQDGKVFWAASTSGGWAPAFPLFRSTGTPTAWKQFGAIFPHPPSWAIGDFWAPELVHDRAHYRVYYVARNRSATLCVAVATAPRPQGPYRDHGPIICQPDGSIDPSFIRDESGKPYLVWKEDGNSRHQPTPIWAQPLTPDGLKLTGRPVQLITNDSPWEGGVVEAPYLLRHGGWFYMFYAGNACCGSQCKYAEGVARARNLLGPWEKDPANPVLRDGQGWHCPGHGSAVEAAAPHEATWFLFHAYSDTGGDYVAREALLAGVEWHGGWPTIGNAVLPSANRREFFIQDDFARTLTPGWQWPLPAEPSVRSGGGRVKLTTTSSTFPAMLGRVIEGRAYSAEVLLESAPQDANAVAGVAVLGDAHRAIVLGLKSGHVVLWALSPSGAKILANTTEEVTGPVELRAEATQPDRPGFSWRRSGGAWKPVDAAIDSEGLLRWDGGLRMGLVVAGPAGSAAIFSHYRQTGHR